MKNLILSSLLVIATAVLTNCSKEGPAGPAGAAGPAGPIGATGPAGPTGNANVTLYKFGGFTHDGVEVQKNFSLTKADYDVSQLFAFIEYNNFLYPLPGKISNLYEYRIFYSSINATTTRFYLARTSGTGNHPITGLRIYAVKPSTTVNSGRFQNAFTNGDYTDTELRSMSHDEFTKALGINN